jgi:hypothetical protein
MPAAEVWFEANDMIVRVSALRSSTMPSGTYLINSTGMSVDIWSSLSTASTGNRVISALNVPYDSASSSGRYQVVIQSTAHSMTRNVVGFADITLNHSGLNGNWKPRLRVDHRRTA